MYSPHIASDRKPTRLGIIGLSAARGWALNAHVPAIAAVSGFELTAISASSLASAQASAAKLGIPYACESAEALALHPEVDMVVIAVKVPEHRRAVTASIAAGKDVLCEWPLGNGVNEANEMAELARAAGIRGFVGLQARAAPPLRFLNDLIAAGEIGEILSTTLVGCGDRWGPTIPPEVSYLIDRDNGATMLTVAMGHSLEALCRCLGELVELSATTATRRRRVRVTGTDEELSMTAEDEIAVTGRLQSGAVAAIHYSGGTSPYPGLRWRIRGTRGTLELRGASGHLQYGRVEIFRSIGTEGEELAPLAVPDEYQLAPVSPDSLSCAVANGYALLARDLAGTTTWTATFADAVRRHRCLAAIELAALSGERQLIG